MFKRKAIPAYLITSLLCAGALAQPLDLDYRVSGYESLRPKLVFNDGNDTFIQGDESLRAVGLPYERQGPYLVVKGVRERIVLEGSGMRKISIIYTGTAITPTMLTQQNGESKVTCDQVAVESKRVELMYGPSNIAPGPLLSKTLQQQAPEISRSAFTQIFITSDANNLAEKRASNLHDYLLNKNVPASKFSIRVVDDSSGQAYMLISTAAPCNQKPIIQASLPVQVTGNGIRGETNYAPPSKKIIKTGDIDTILQLLSEDKITEETASTMIANIRLSRGGTKLERLFTKNMAADSQKKPDQQAADVASKSDASNLPGLANKPNTNQSFGESKTPEKDKIAGQFTVENLVPIDDKTIKGEVFPIESFAKKPSTKTMVRLAGIVGEKYQTLFIVKGDGSPEAKAASSNAAKALLRLGVESVRFDRGSNKGEIEVLEEGEKK